MIWDGKPNPSFQAIQQLYVEVHDLTVNVTFVLGEIRERWGQSCVLVTNHGLEIEDSPATKGYLHVLNFVQIHVHCTCKLISVISYACTCIHVYTCTSTFMQL